MQYFKPIIILITIFYVSCSAASTSKAESLSKTGFYSSQDEIIKKLDNDKAGYKEHFLLGLSYKKTGEPKKAIFHFANSCFQYSRNLTLKIYPYPVHKYVNEFHIKSDYYNDAVYEIAELFFEYREYEYTINFINLIGKSDSGLFRDAVILKSNTMIEIGKYDDAVSSLNKLLLQYDDINSKSLIHIRIASAYERRNDFTNAIGEYLNVLSLGTKTWQSGIACGQIRKLVSKYEYKFNDEEEFLLAVSLYNSSRAGDSIDILKNLTEKDTKYPLKHDILKYSVKAYIQDGKINEAGNLISRYTDNASLYYELLKIEADELWTINKKGLAFNIYQKLYKKTEGEILKESHKRIVQFFISRNDPNYEKILIEYKDKYPEDKTLEAFFWILIKDKLKEKKNNTAIKYLEDMLSLFPATPYSGRNRYWLAKLYLYSGRADDAMQRIKEMVVINPDSAYTWKKLEELKGEYKIDEIKTKFKECLDSKNAESAVFYHALLFIQEKDFAERDIRIQSLDFIDTIKKYQKFDDNLNEQNIDSKYKDNLKEIKKYFDIGYTEGIVRETGIIPDNRQFQPDKYKTLAYFGGKYYNYYFTVTSILKLLKYYHLPENIFFLSRGTIAKLFPQAFSGQVEKICSERDIPEEMAYAVMKAESSFNHRAVSPAGASGIMQLMPATANGISKEIKVKEYDLKNPLNSINFGIIYLSWLKKFFNGNFEKMVAGYNAGAGNVKKWIKEMDTPDDDYFIEFIPFEETRYYVLRTSKFFIQYRLIYNHAP